MERTVDKMFKLCILVIIAGLCVVLNNALPPGLTIGWQGAARTPITITRLGINVASWLTPCDVSRAPTEFHYRSDEECVDRCPGHCASIMNCNATCVVGNRCVCAAWRYCFINRDKVNPDGSYVFDDCYYFDEGVPQS